MAGAQSPIARSFEKGKKLHTNVNDNQMESETNIFDLASDKNYTFEIKIKPSYCGVP